MKDKLYLTSRIGDVTHEFIPNDKDRQLVRDSRIEILYWCLNGGNLRTQAEVDNYISNLSEEIFGYSFINDNCNLKKIAEAKLIELKYFNED